MKRKKMKLSLTLSPLFGPVAAARPSSSSSLSNWPEALHSLSHASVAHPHRPIPPLPFWLQPQLACPLFPLLLGPNAIRSAHASAQLFLPTSSLVAEAAQAHSPPSLSG